jgi:DNA-directed RNA polymerase subunit M/transcription elongation factor TFIIS
MLREESRIHFNGILENEPVFQCLSQHTKTSLVNRLESSCHNANIAYCKANHIPTFWDDENFVEHYSANIYRVSINLDPKSSVNSGSTPPFNRLLMNSVLLTTLVEDTKSALSKIKNRHKLIDRIGILIKQIGYMSSLELNSYSSQNYLDMLAIRANQKVEVKTTKMYACPQCHKRNATFYQLQTRSGDEGYTTFIQCQICEHRWTLR